MYCANCLLPTKFEELLSSDSDRLSLFELYERRGF